MDKSWCRFKKTLTGSHGRGAELANSQKPVQSQEVPQKQTWAQRELGNIPLSSWSLPGRGFQALLPFPLSVLLYKLLSNKYQLTLTLITLQLLTSPLYLPYKKYWPHICSHHSAMDLTVSVLECKHRNTIKVGPLQNQESCSYVRESRKQFGVGAFSVFFFSVHAQCRLNNP